LRVHLRIHQHADLYVCQHEALSHLRPLADDRLELDACAWTGDNHFLAGCVFEDPA
jgi:hypothetical protein